MIQFKNARDLAYEAFYSCRVLDCTEEATKLYATETNVIDVCQNHHKQLIERDYQ